MEFMLVAPRGYWVSRAQSREAASGYNHGGPLCRIPSSPPGLGLRLRPRLPGVAAPGRGRLSGLARFVPPPFRQVIQFPYFRRYLPGLVDLPPGVHAAERALGDLAEQAAHPVGLRPTHRELVIGL